MYPALTEEEEEEEEEQEEAPAPRVDLVRDLRLFPAAAAGGAEIDWSIVSERGGA